MKGFKELNSWQKDVIGDVFSDMSITFTEVSLTGDGGDIRFNSIGLFSASEAGLGALPSSSPYAIKFQVVVCERSNLS